MKKSVKKITSIFLSLLMVLSVCSGFSFAASAADTPKAIELVSDGTASFILGAQQSSVWFGNYKQSSDGNGGYNVEPVKWRVLTNEDGKLFLLADQNLDAIQYNGNHEDVTWDTCEIRDWLNGYGSMQDVGFLGTAFTAKEQAAIAASTVVSEENPQYSVYGGEDTTDKVFLLSAGEAVTAAYGFTDNYGNTDSRVAINTDYVENRVTFHFNDGAGRWWLRSTGESNDKAAFVSQSGQMNLKGIEAPTSSVAVRPAANVDLGQVLFVSPAVGGKPAPDAEMDDIFVKNAYGKNIMSPVSDYNGFDWKLTVLDSSRSNFTARCLAFKTGTKNATCKIRYSNATGGEYDRISAMIVDADGHVKYSGVLGYANPATTTFETDVTGQYTPGDRIFIYNEEVHGDKQTDYSSHLIDITPEKLPEGLTATVGQRLADVAIPNPEGNTSGTWTWDDPTTDIDTAGEYSFAATFTPSNTDAFETLHTNLTVTINKQDPTATPPTGLAATVGQTLADVVIPNPEGNTSGTWTWDAPSTYLNVAGEYSFAATFTPTNIRTFKTVHTNLTVTVTAEPNYEFPSGLTAYYGQTLNDVRRWLPSGWAWDDPSTSVGEVGEHMFPATYTPSDTANYSTVSAMLSVTVEKGWSYSPPIKDLTATVGDTLADVPLPDGWAWDDPSTSLGLVGTYDFPVTFTPEDTTHYRITHAVADVIVKHVTVEFGSYPQSQVTDPDLTAALNAQTLDWQSYGYYCKLGDRIVAGDFMEYCDVTLDGAKYRGVRFSLYRPEKTEYGASPESSCEYHQENNGYYTNTIYWFRYEPLQWCVLDLSTGLAMCETVIDSQPYNNFMLRADDAYYYGDADHSYYANNYEKSSIRDWLNADFYNTAFTNAQKSKIAATTIDNRAFDTSHSVYDSASTTDKVFLLSYSDMRNTAYGFESDPDFSSTRGAQVSDYAKCQGLLVQTGYDWWLRSAGEYSGLACTVLSSDSYGAVVTDYYDVDYTCAGVRPAITLDQRETPTVTVPTGLTATAGQTLADVTLTNPDGNTPGTWTWDAPSTTLSETGEFSFAATFTPNDTVTYHPVHVNLTVTVSEALPTYTVSLGGTQSSGITFLRLNGQLQNSMPFTAKYGDSVTVVFEPEDQMISAMTYTYIKDGKPITYTISFDANAYPVVGSFQMPASDVTVRLEFSDVYNIIEDTDHISNCVISSDVTIAAAGSEVTVYAAPNEGCVFDSWRFTPAVDLLTDITDENGIRVATFIMPEGDMAVAASFVRQADLDQAAAVIDLIDAIDDPVVYTTDCKAKIDAARNAYNALTTKQKALVTNYDVLNAAEETYESLAPSQEPTSYTVTVPDGCTVTQTDVDGIDYKLATITAPATNANGDKFVYWTDNSGNIVSTYRTYHFYVGCDADYTPVYASAADYDSVRANALITSRVVNVTYSVDGLIFLGEHSVSKSAELNGHGILVSTNADAATAQTLVTGSDSDDVYNFQAQTTKNSKTGMLQATAALVADTVWVRTYVIDGNGDVHYGQIQSYNVSELDEHSFDEEIIELDAQNDEEIVVEDELVEEASGIITMLINIIKMLLEKLEVIFNSIISMVK